MRLLSRIAAAIMLAGAFVLPIRADAQTAPNFTGVDQWFNSGPLSIASLRGKVVLVNFWTSGCINCIRTLPHVTRMHALYHDKGLVVVGVHTPEFPFERSAAGIEAAIKRHGIHYPVAQDNAYATWKAYGNHYWPAQYIIDKNGRIALTHFGEGNHAMIEQTIRRLLGAQS
jgi:thiol-disulfide isomerase/thioredoxin